MNQKTTGGMRPKQTRGWKTVVSRKSAAVIVGISNGIVVRFGISNGSENTITYSAQRTTRLTGTTGDRTAARAGGVTRAPAEQRATAGEGSAVSGATGALRRSHFESAPGGSGAPARRDRRPTPRRGGRARSARRRRPT